jgi:peptidyl-prolyl cis-trans isomerase SurA
MRMRVLNFAVEGRRVSQFAILVVLAADLAVGRAQTPSQPAVPAGQQAAAAGAPGKEIMLDRVVAIVNGDLILQSDLDAEERFEAFQPFSEAKPVSRDQLIERLIDRTLIFQQMALQPPPPITDAEVDAELNLLRKEIPQCAAYHCDTEAGWKKFVEDHGFTLPELEERWRQRMEVLRFIEQRFRAGIFDTITPAQIDEYYKQTMIPAYQKENATPPAEATVADRIKEILLQQQVDKLLDDWLTALRAQGSVRILKPGEEAP